MVFKTIYDGHNWEDLLKLGYRAGDLVPMHPPKDCLEAAGDTWTDK